MNKANTGIAFYVDDLEKTYTELSSRGIEFTTKPKKTEYGNYAMFKDS